MSSRIAAAALLALALAACERTPVQDPDAPPAADAVQAARGDNAFDVEVTLSELAHSALAAEQLEVEVSAEYFGYPTVAAQQRNLAGTHEPWLGLHQHTVRMAGAGSAHFPAVRLDANQLTLVEQGRPHLLVDVRSAGADAAENLLDCGTFQDALAVAVRNGVRIDCKLIAE